MKSDQTMIECLESRRLLSSVTLGFGGVLRVVGDFFTDDTITVGVSGGQIEVAVSGEQPRLFDHTAVTGLRIHGLSGSDTITIDDSSGPLGFRAYVNGGTGDDVLTGGSEGNTMFGGPGNDQIDSGHGRNWIHAGDGNDTVTAGDGIDVVYAGPGNDSVTTAGNRDFVRGGSGDDTISAGAGNDTAFGEAGDDQIFGGDGSDVLVGGTDDDLVDGNEGSNILFGILGRDTLLGGASRDRAYVGPDATVDLDGGDNIIRQVDPQRIQDAFERFANELLALRRHLLELR